MKEPESQERLRAEFDRQAQEAQAHALHTDRKARRTPQDEEL